MIESKKWKIIEKLKSNPNIVVGWEMFADEMLFWLNYSHGHIEKELITNRVKRMRRWGGMQKAEKEER